MEQQPLFNSVNFDVEFWSRAKLHHSLHRGKHTLVPQRPRCLRAQDHARRLDADPGAVTMYYTSYAGNTGTWMLWYQQDSVPQKFMNGLFHIHSAVRLAEHHRRHQQHAALRRARPRPARRGLGPVVALVDLGQLRRHDVLHALADEPVPEGPASSQLGDARARLTSAAPRACTPAAATSPSPTARCGSSRTRSTPGPTTRRRAYLGESPSTPRGPTSSSLGKVRRVSGTLHPEWRGGRLSQRLLTFLRT